MIMKTTKLFLAAIAALAFASCQNETVELPKEVFAKIHANLDNKALATRAYQQTWESNDVIGLFVNGGTYKYKYNGSEITINNQQFKNTAGKNPTAVFEGITDATKYVLFPSSGEEITFHAYYPYNSNLDANNYEITNWDVQSNLSDDEANAVDILISDNVKGSQTSRNVNLEFSHAFSKLRLTIITNSETSQLLPEHLENMTVAAQGMSPNINLNVLNGNITNPEDAANPLADNGETINFKKNGTNLQYEAVICPGFNASGRQIVFTYKDSKNVVKSCTWTLTNSDIFSAGNCYDYTVRLTGDGLAQAVLTGTIKEWGTVSKGTVNADGKFE